MNQHLEIRTSPASLKARRIGRVLGWCLLASTYLANPYLANPLSAADGNSDDWALDVVRLKDGTIYRGLIQAEDEQALEFAEIVRPAGKAMHAVIRPLARADISRVQPVSDEARQKLVERFAAFRQRARIESERMENLALQRTRSEQADASQPRTAAEMWRYEGPWFQVHSTSDERTTRQCIVRIEQMFRAYRQLLPPRTSSVLTGPSRTRPLRVLLFGSMDEYRQHLHERRLALEASAFYSARDNTIVAGSELARYSRRLEAVRRQNEAQRQHYERLDDEFNERFAERAAQMKEDGFSRQEIKFERQIRLAAWEREFRARLEKLDQNQRDNEAKFAMVAEAMFTRLYHEAFHAYLENYVFPQREYRVPRWLNEGLAQVFEAGRLDGDLLRIDAPDSEKLRHLQEDLRNGPLPLADVLAARHDSFLVTHSQEASYRHYLYAWGLAYYLAFDQNPAGSTAAEPGTAPVTSQAVVARIQQFVLPLDSPRKSEIEQFEDWTSQPLDQFEAQWRAAILALKP